MKRQWQPEELIEHFIVLPDEQALLPTKTNATAHNQLGFAVLLKFFQYAARFPLHKNEVPCIGSNVHRQSVYQTLKQPLEADTFIARLQQQMTEALSQLNQELPSNRQVKIKKQDKGLICVSPLTAQPEPLNLIRVKTEMARGWPMTSLLDILKETDLRVHFTEHFTHCSLPRKPGALHPTKTSIAVSVWLRNQHRTQAGLCRNAR